MKSKRSHINAITSIFLATVLAAAAFDFAYLFKDTTFVLDKLYHYQVWQTANKFLYAGYTLFLFLTTFFLIKSTTGWRAARLTLVSGLWFYLSSFGLTYVKINWLTGLPYRSWSVILTLAATALALLVVAYLLLLLSRSDYALTVGRLFIFLLLVVLALEPWLMAYKLPAIRTSPVEYKDLPNIVFVLTDTVNTKHLSTYGYERPTSPNLTEFRDNATFFKRAYSTASWTKASVASIFTGLYPQVHNANSIPAKLPSEATTLAETLRANGYRTINLTANTFTSRKFGLAQGFEEVTPLQQKKYLSKGQFHTVLGKMNVTWLAFDENVDPEAETDAARINQLAKEKLRENSSSRRPFFLYLHYMDPHDPYAPPKDLLKTRNIPDTYNFKSYSENYLRRGWWPSGRKIYPFAKKETAPAEVLDQLIYQHDAEIRYWDHHFGKLVSFLKKHGLFDESLLVMTADHGEEFFEHNNWHHGHSLFNELIKVPLLIKSPGKNNSQTVKHPVSLVNLKSTLMGLISPPHTPGAKESSFAGALGANSAETDDTGTVFSRETGRFSYDMISLIRPPWKLLRIRQGDNLAWRLFNLSEDPGETTDLQERKAKKFKKLKSRLSKWSRKYKNRGFDSGKAELSETAKEELRGLGYIE